MAYAKHVTLGFDHGGELPDLTSLLRGGGRQAGRKLAVRSLKITSIDEIGWPELRQLVADSVAHMSAS